MLPAAHRARHPPPPHRARRVRCPSRPSRLQPASPPAARPTPVPAADALAAILPPPATRRAPPTPPSARLHRQLPVATRRVRHSPPHPPLAANMVLNILQNHISTHSLFVVRPDSRYVLCTTSLTAAHNHVPHFSFLCTSLRKVMERRLIHHSSRWRLSPPRTCTSIPRSSLSWLLTVDSEFHPQLPPRHSYRTCTTRYISPRAPSTSCC